MTGRPDRFMDHVPDHLPADQCWPWAGPVAERYPGAPLRARASGGRWAARVMYERTVGPIPDKHEVDHLCGNTLCVNPKHLEPVTKAENMRRESERRTHCVNGHEFTEATTYDRTGKSASGGRRGCRPCNAAAQRRRQQRIREQVPA